MSARSASDRQRHMQWTRERGVTAGEKGGAGMLEVLAEGDIALSCAQDAEAHFEQVWNFIERRGFGTWRVSQAQRELGQAQTTLQDCKKRSSTRDARQIQVAGTALKIRHQILSPPSSPPAFFKTLCCELTYEITLDVTEQTVSKVRRRVKEAGELVTRTKVIAITVVASFIRKGTRR